MPRGRAPSCPGSLIPSLPVRSSARLAWTTREAKELLDLARRRRGDPAEGGPLTADEGNRYKGLVEQAAGEPGLFERRRAERAEAAKLATLQVAERRHPQAYDLVAAVMSDPFLFDGLKHRFRPDATVLDDLGREQQGVSAVRIYEYENIAALHVIVSLIVANGGQEIVVGEHGFLPDGLPNLPSGALTQLRRNGWLEATQEGTGTHVGLGPRVREIAERWGIELPEPAPVARADTWWRGASRRSLQPVLAHPLRTAQGHPWLSPVCHGLGARL